MRILYIVRQTFYDDPGGDTVQVLNTANELRKKGYSIDIQLTKAQIDYSSYTLIHFFNIIRPSDILKHIQRSCKPYVVSTIFVDYSAYEKQHARGVKKFLLRMLTGAQIEYLKILLKFILKGEPIISPQYLLFGHKNSIQKILRKAALILPNSENEYKRIVDAFSINAPYIVVPNGINPSVFSDSTSEKDPAMVLSIGRIEGRKNQLNLIKALNNSPYKLYIIGKPAKNQRSYYEACRSIAGDNIFFIDNIPQKELIPYLKRAKVHVLASWFETTGLSSLEAACMMCNIVITEKGDTRDYFGQFGFYCQPESIQSIRSAIDMAARQPYPEKLKQNILKHFTWEQAGIKTAEAYEQVIKHSK